MEKSRISKAVSEVICDEILGRKIKDSERNSPKNSGGGTNFISLFCGTCSVESKVAPYFENVVCNDIHKYLIAMLNAVKHGYTLPDYISEEEYKYIKLHKDDDPALAGFVGFGCSFGGRWFQSYARSKKTVNYAAQSKRSLLKDMEYLYNAKFVCRDYKDVEIPEQSVVYCDPPYKDTAGYGIKFDSAEFFDYARKLTEAGHKVFISEQQAPEDFVSIWEKPITRSLNNISENRLIVTEKLFIHESQFQKE